MDYDLADTHHVDHRLTSSAQVVGSRGKRPPASNPLDTSTLKGTAP